MTSILDEKPSEALDRFLDEYIHLFPHLSKDTAIYNMKSESEFFNELTTEWYKHLDAGDLEAAYQVYNHDYYISDIWNCWQLYSRRYLRNLRDCQLPNATNAPLTFHSLTKDAKVVVDLGNGIGHATAGLRELYPEAEVYGTNLKITKQWLYNISVMARRHDFKMVEDVTDIPHDQVDMIFASEYFEHFDRPMEHMKHVFDHIKPRYLVLANAFNTWSIGHFRMYFHGDQKIHESKISDVFNNYLKGLGYEKIKTDYFNDRPSVWKLNEQTTIFDF